MEALQSIGQFFARWLAQLETTFVEKQRYLLLVDGLKNTLIITAGALVIGVVIGSLVAMIKYCGQDSRLLRPLCWLCSVYTTVIRGVPVVVQLLIFYFLILKSSDGLVVGIVTFGINSGAYVAELVGKTDRTIMNIENKGQRPSFNLFFKLVTLFDISVDQFFYTEGQRGENSCRKHIDVLLSSMNEKELVVMEATAEGLKKARETEVQEVWLFCVSSMYWWKQSKHGLLH